MAQSLVTDYYSYSMNVWLREIENMVGVSQRVQFELNKAMSRLPESDHLDFLGDVYQRIKEYDAAPEGPDALDIERWSMRWIWRLQKRYRRAEDKSRRLLRATSATNSTGNQWRREARKRALEGETDTGIEELESRDLCTAVATKARLSRQEHRLFTLEYIERMKDTKQLQAELQLPNEDRLFNLRGKLKTKIAAKKGCILSMLGR